LEVSEPVMPTKEEMERKYKRQARYEREKKGTKSGIYNTVIKRPWTWTRTE